MCEESMRLTAFHTPDGLYCWNRLLMGAKPSSAVQQSAYLEALDDYIDFYEDGTPRKCLLDEHGNRLKDKEGNLKTLLTDSLCTAMISALEPIPLRSFTSCLKPSSVVAKGLASR